VLIASRTTTSIAAISAAVCWIFGNADAFAAAQFVLRPLFGLPSAYFRLQHAAFFEMPSLSMRCAFC
jgi:hypothetical protein